MRKGGSVSRCTAAVAGLVASLVFSLPGLAVARPGDARADASTDSYSGPAGIILDTGHPESDENSAAVNTDYAAAQTANCGKCHNSCENGRSHQGLVATGRSVHAALPLDAGGRTTCSTCHDSHRPGGEGVSGWHLRMPNLQRELCLACHRQETEVSPRIEIVSPLERAIVHEGRIALIGRTSRLAGATLTVRLNGEAFHLQVKEGGFVTWLNLQDGVNHIELLLEERILWGGEVFRGESAVDGYSRMSSGHCTGNRDECLGCHARTEAMGAQTAGTSPALCYGCHERNDVKRFVHGPLAVGDCLACHDPHSGYGVAHLRQEQELLCRTCHAIRGNSPPTACDRSLKACVDCHDPHQSDLRYLLKGPQYTLHDVSTERSQIAARASLGQAGR